MNNTIDINCDMGESFGTYKMGADEDVIKYVSSINIACGFHAGDPLWIDYTVKLAEKYNVHIGAHPSFPDIKGFGRRTMDLTAEEIKSDIKYQVGALSIFTKNKKLQHIKPHGALYNMAVDDQKIATSICEALLEIDPTLILLGLSGSQWLNIAEKMGIQVAHEVFADRSYNSDGTLVSRKNPNATLHDPQLISDRCLQIINENSITSIDGDKIDIKADSICVHGDNPDAVEIAVHISKTLTNESVVIHPLRYE